MRILLAEDDGPLADVLARGLRRSGYVVDVARRGDEALAHLRTSDYAAAVIDWAMPGLAGTDVIRDARAAGRTTPVLMLTARDTTADRVTGLDAGADDYLVKPFDFDELLARIRALMRRAHHVTQSELRSANLTLDPATNEVRVGAEPVQLTPREYAILELLLRQSPRTVSRTTIAEQVWDIGEEISWNAIEAHIARLRAKLARADVQVLAVRSVGYRLVPA